MKKNRPLNIKIACYFLVSNFVLVLVLGSIFFFSSSHLLRKQDMLTAKEGIEKRGNFIELYTEKLKGLSEMISQDESILRYLSTKSQEERERILHLMKNAISIEPSIQSIVLIGKDGEVVSNESFLDMEVSTDMMKEEWYVKALATDMPVLNPLRKQNFSSDSMEHWVISVSREIKDSLGNNLGVLLIDVKYQALHEYLANNNVSDYEDIIILDENQKIVYYKDIPCVEAKEACMRKLNSFQEEKRDPNSLILKYPIRNTNWTLVAISSFQALSKLKLHFVELLAFSALASLLITFLLSTWIVKRITKPIQELEQHMRNFSNDMKKISLKGDISEEVLSLQNHFNDMISKIHYLRDYEIQALHSQINPHFLYNTLDTIVWMAEFEDTEKVISITKALANFFRISLSQGKEKITLREELQHIQEYLFIQKQRYEEKLSYELSVDSSLLEYEVPKIILQPIVENAIYHGIKNLEGNGLLKIYSEIYEEDFSIIIEDNGVGFEKAKEYSIRKKGGIGLKNVHKRIQYYYGEKYGISKDESFHEGTRIKILLAKK